jgi:hypothetical protein
VAPALELYSVLTQLYVAGMEVYLDMVVARVEGGDVATAAATTTATEFTSVPVIDNLWFRLHELRADAQTAASRAAREVRRALRFAQRAAGTMRILETAKKLGSDIINTDIAVLDAQPEKRSVRFETPTKPEDAFSDGPRDVGPTASLKTNARVATPGTGTAPALDPVFPIVASPEVALPLPPWQAAPQTPPQPQAFEPGAEPAPAGAGAGAGAVAVSLPVMPPPQTPGAESSDVTLLETRLQQLALQPPALPPNFGVGMWVWVPKGAPKPEAASDPGVVPFVLGGEPGVDSASDHGPETGGDLEVGDEAGAVTQPTARLRSRATFAPTRVALTRARARSGSASGSSDEGLVEPRDRPTPNPKKRPQLPRDKYGRFLPRNRSGAVCLEVALVQPWPEPAPAMDTNADADADAVLKSVSATTATSTGSVSDSEV